MATSTSQRRPGVSRTMIRHAIDAAEPSFSWCWDVLAAAQDGGGAKFGANLLAFQSRLLDGLRPIEEAYLAVKREEKRLIARKSRYAPAWFARRMKALSTYRALLLDALAIGRATGDGFAWLFYEQDRDLVIEHLKHQRQVLLPTGLGGLGERLALERMQGLDGKLLLYHGVTTFLRMGDVSFIDLKRLRVASIGEIKTEEVAPGELRLRVHLLSDRRDGLPHMPGDKRAADPPPKLDAPVQARLDRQLETFGSAISRAANRRPDRAIGTHGDFHYDALTDVVGRAHHRGFEYVQAGPSMVLAAVRPSRGGGLSANMFGRRGGPMPNIADAPSWAIKIMASPAAHNALFLGWLGCGEEGLVVSRESMPLAAWPIPASVRRDIVLGRVLVLSIYNPAHLWEALRARGFKLSWDSRSRLEKAVCEDGSRAIAFENFDFFHRLTQTSLMAHASVLKLLDETLELVETPGVGPGTKIMLDARVHSHRPERGDRGLAEARADAADGEA